MAKVEIYGASDDLIEIEGDIDEEFNVLGEEGKSVLAFSLRSWRLSKGAVGAMSSAECNQCGDCCEVIPANVNLRKLRERFRFWLVLGDPTEDEAWARWQTNNYTPSRKNAIELYYEVSFILKHWVSLGDNDVTCLAFDSVTRKCTVQEQKPRVCWNYPWYGDEPTDDWAQREGSSSRDGGRGRSSEGPCDDVGLEIGPTRTFLPK